MGQGMSRLDAIRQIGVVEQTYYRWRNQYGGMGLDQLKELKRLQKENEQLRIRIGSQVQPKSMQSIIDTTQREQRRGSA